MKTNDDDDFRIISEMLRLKAEYEHLTNGKPLNDAARLRWVKNRDCGVDKLHKNHRRLLTVMTEYCTYLKQFGINSKR